MAWDYRITPELLQKLQRWGLRRPALPALLLQRFRNELCAAPLVHLHDPTTLSARRYLEYPVLIDLAAEGQPPDLVRCEFDVSADRGAAGGDGILSLIDGRLFDPHDEEVDVD